MAILPRYVGRDWVRVVQVVVIAFMESAIFALYIAGGWLLPGRKRVVPYSIQTLKRLKPALFRQDLIALLDLLQQKKIKPLIAQRFPLAEARHAQELLGKGGVIGKIVLVRNGSSLESQRREQPGAWLTECAGDILDTVFDRDQEQEESVAFSKVGKGRVACSSLRAEGRA